MWLGITWLCIGKIRWSAMVKLGLALVGLAWLGLAWHGISKPGWLLWSSLASSGLVDLALLGLVNLPFLWL